MVSIVNKNLLTLNPNKTKDRVENNELLITDGSSIIPTYNGYCTGLAYAPIFFLPHKYAVKILNVTELQDDTGLLVITSRIIYKYNRESGVGSVIKTFSVEAENVSIAYVGSYYYILVDGLLYKYDHINNAISVINPTGFPVSAEFIIATNNRLVALSADTVAWSAIGNGSDFTPSILTGAGFQSLDSLSTGRGVALAAKKNGFVIFTTNNMISVTELNTSLIYNFKEVSKHRLYNRNCCVTSTFGIIYFIDSDKNLYSYEDLGSLGSGGFKVVNEIFDDYFNSINVKIERISLVEARYIVINYQRNIIGIDLLYNKLFKVRHNKYNVNSFYFIEDNHFFSFNYRSVYNTLFDNISYYGNYLELDSSPSEMCATMTMFSDMPTNSVVASAFNDVQPDFLGIDVGEPNVFDIDLNDDLINLDLNDDLVYIDLNDYDNTWPAGAEFSAGFYEEYFTQADKIVKVDAEFEFASLHFSPEIPIECTTVITRVDTNLTNNAGEFLFDCQLGAPLYDCVDVPNPDFVWNLTPAIGYDIALELGSSTDAYGKKPHHIVPVKDTYYVGKRLVGNIYNTGIYHYLRYSIKGYVEITGIQFNLFKGGYIYDR